MNNKSIIDFGFRIVWRIMEISEAVIRLGLRPRRITPVGGELLPIHSLKWNPNDVLTTCKAISNGLVSGFVYWSCTLRLKTIDQRTVRSTVLRKNKNMAAEDGTVSHFNYILVIRKFIDFMSLFRHSVWFSFSVKQFPFAEFGICNI